MYIDSNGIDIIMRLNPIEPMNNRIKKYDKYYLFSQLDIGNFYILKNLKQQNKGLVLCVIDEYIDNIRMSYFNKRFHNDRDFILHMIPSKYFSYNLILNTELKYDTEIILKSLEYNKIPIKDFYKIFANDQTILHKLWQYKLYTYNEQIILPNYIDPIIYNSLDYTLKKNYFVINKYIIENPSYKYNIQYAPHCIKDDVCIMLNCIQDYPYALIYASDRLQQNEGFIKHSFIINPKSFIYTDKSIRNNKNIGIFVVSLCGIYIEYLSDDLKDNLDVAMQAITCLNTKKGKTFKSIHNIGFKSEKEYIPFKFVSKRLRNEYDLVEKSLKINLATINLLDEKYRVLDSFKLFKRSNSFYGISFIMYEKYIDLGAVFNSKKLKKSLTNFMKKYIKDFSLDKFEYWYMNQEKK